MPLLLYSYISAEILAPFFASLLILNGVLFIGRLMQVVDLIFAMNIGLTDFIRLCVYLSPKLLLFSLPMASSIAVIIAFTRLTNDNEIVALKAAGVSLYKMMPPVILFAACTALITGYSAVHFIPAGSTAMNNLFIKLATEKINSGVRARRFSDNTGALVIYAEEVTPRTRAWKGVYISDLRDKAHPVTIIAARGTLTPHLDRMYISLSLDNGTMHRTDGRLTQTIKFAHYNINLPVKPPKLIAGVGTSRSSMTQEALLKAAHNPAKTPAQRAEFLSEYHKRLALAGGCFILTILGMPLALRGRPGRRNLALPVGIGFFLLYFICLSIAESLTMTTILPVGLIMWLPNIILGFITIIITRSTAAEGWQKHKLT